MGQQEANNNYKLIWYRALIVSTRPKQWIKNLIIYLALLFTVGESWDLNNVEGILWLSARSTVAFVMFCVITASVYIINDVLDRDKDQHHPEKQNRPIAANKIGIKLALMFAGMISIVGVLGSYLLSPASFFIAIGYFALMILYSIYLKQIVIIDVITISLGFIIRAVAGAVAIGVSVSPWLYVCTGLAALFIGFSKRLSEKTSAQQDGYLQRETLREYSVEFLHQLIAISATSSLLAYTLYTFSSPNLPTNNTMMLTIPFVVYGLLRYLFLVSSRNLGESPEEIILKDFPLQLSVVAWLLVSISVLIYYR